MAAPSKLPALLFQCTLQSSLLTLTTLSLVTFSYLSLKSLFNPATTNPVANPLSIPVVHHDLRELLPDVYHIPEVFRLNYKAMERDFKVFVYPDGDPKTFYQTPRKLTGKYASEGYFFQNIRESRFRTDNPDEAHLFFIPISCHKMRGKGTSYENMTVIVKDYLDGLIAKYPYWNRTLGADHFFVTCHDVGVRATEGVPDLVKNAIRVICSPSYNVGFIPHKDVALPQVLQPFPLPAGGNDVENRTTLGFWSGHRNSKIRVILARVWENDTELYVLNNRINRATGNLLYQKKFFQTKFCICPGGSQVNSARIADSIHYGCVPVILSDYYDLPFNDILIWRKFSVILRERDVYKLKQELKNITDDEFLTLHQNLVKFFCTVGLFFLYFLAIYQLNDDHNQKIPSTMNFGSLKFRCQVALEPSRRDFTSSIMMLTIIISSIGVLGYRNTSNGIRLLSNMMPSTWSCTSYGYVTMSSSIDPVRKTSRILSYLGCDLVDISKPCILPWRSFRLVSIDFVRWFRLLLVLGNDFFHSPGFFLRLVELVGLDLLVS